MAYDPIERLRNGNVDFLLEDRFTSYDTTHLIERIRELPDKNEVIRAFLPKLIKYRSIFCFEIIYDNNEFEKDVKKLLSSERKDLFILNTEKLNNLLNKTNWGEDYIYINLDSILVDDEIVRMNFIIPYIYEKSLMKNKWVDKFIKNDDMHKRAIFLKVLINLYPKDANVLLNNYEDILEDKPEIGEQISLFPPKINDKDLSEIAVAALHSNMDRSVFEKLKNYVLQYYEKNDVAQLLLTRHNRDNREEDSKVFEDNANQLFTTSRKYQFFILNNYINLVNKEILERYKYILELERIFKESKPYTTSPLNGVYEYELGNQLQKIIDKYLSLSKDPSISFLQQGSMSSAFRLGDYVLKLGKGKWSYEDIICPNVYLILKNLEEFYIRNNVGVVVANMEVQPFLKRKSTDLSDDYITTFHKELSKFGYYTDELRYREQFGENFGVLDSYQDADCKDPELLPDHFKKTPLVLYDRDRVFKIGKQPKVLRETIGD